MGWGNFGISKVCIFIVIINKPCCHAFLRLKAHFTPKTTTSVANCPEGACANICMILQ